ncbi:MAG: hypothetical protein WCH61_02765, partial [bacterium]
TDNLHDDQHVKEVAEAGIDFLFAVKAQKNVLDLCKKYQIGVIADSNLPLWWGGDGKNAGQYGGTVPPEKLDVIKQSYRFHPALWGDYLVDEPNVKDFASIAANIKRYHALFPGQLVSVMLYPIYANTAPLGITPELQQVPSQLGTTTYQEYISQYVKTIGTDYISFDSYPFTGPFASYLENLDLVGTACRESGRDMWVIIQAGAWKADALLGEYQIRWQAYLCLAYGAKIIIHATYSPGWWDGTTSCVNAAGEKNVTYGYVKNVNAELHALSGLFMQYDSLGVYPCGNLSGASQSMAPQLAAQAARNGARATPAERNLLAGIKVDGAAIAGCFKRKDGGGYAVMLVNAQDPWNAAASVTVSMKAPGVAYVKGIKTPLGSGLKLASGEGVFITMD